MLKRKSVSDVDEQLDEYKKAKLIKLREDKQALINGVLANVLARIEKVNEEIKSTKALTRIPPQVPRFIWDPMTGCRRCDGSGYICKNPWIACGCNPNAVLC